jgi:hypothetical protein
MCRRPGELELFVVVEHSSNAHQLEPDDGAVVVVFDGVPLRRLERLGRRSLQAFLTTGKYRGELADARWVA